MQDLADLTQLLLPTMAAARRLRRRVPGGAWQVGTLFAADALTTLIHDCCSAGLPHRSRLGDAALPESSGQTRGRTQKLISWLLCGAVTAFAIFRSAACSPARTARRSKGGADGGLRRGAGGQEHSRESAEMVLSAAHFAARGHQGGRRAGRAARLPRAARAAGRAVLLYRAAAFVSAVSGVKPLERLLEQLGDAFASSSA